jgi:hypothetical protein
VASSANVTSTGTVLATPGTALSIHYRAVATAGTVVLKDGGGSGTTKLTFHTGAAAGSGSFVIPGGGIQFDTDIHATLTQCDSLTVVYQ